MISSFQWIIPALIAAFAQAASPLICERFSVQPMVALWWMRLVGILGILPFALATPAPQNPIFYILILIGAVIFSYSDIIRTNVAAKNGAGIVTRLDPLSVALTFVLWTGLNPKQLHDYLMHPMQFLGMSLSLMGTVYFALRLGKCKINRTAINTLIPQLLLSAIGIILGKYAMNLTNPQSGAVYYALVQCGFVWLIYIGLQISPLAHQKPHLVPKISDLFTRISVLSGVLCGLAWLLHTPMKWYAIAQVSNPAYITIIGLSAPFWVLLFYRLIGKKEEGDVKSGLGIVICTAIMIYFCILEQH
jgi:hypothetical protein